VSTETNAVGRRPLWRRRLRWPLTFWRLYRCSRKYSGILRALRCAWEMAMLSVRRYADE
jgi:hypothetical protein